MRPDDILRAERQAKKASRGWEEARYAIAAP